MPTRFPPPLTYRDAGVDIDRGDELVDRIKPLAASTAREGLLAGVGGFGALFEVPTGRYRQPVLVSGTDGVGTKLRLAIAAKRHDTIGIDLVAMCANDVLTAGAEPLYFLDYFATGHLDAEVAAEVVGGIAAGCRLAGAALIGGETAEMPGMYADGDYDLAGFCVGVVEKDAIIDGSTVTPGDAVIGLASSGVHSNGYSLVRAVLARTGAGFDDPLGDTTLGEILLTPTRIYARGVLALAARIRIKAIAHITGGGLPGNLPRVLPDGTRARLRAATWREQPIFEWIRAHGGIERDEMYRTFNCGIGLALCVAGEDAGPAVDLLSREGETAQVIGAIEPASGPATVDIE